MSSVQFKKRQRDNFHSIKNCRKAVTEEDSQGTYWTEAEQVKYNVILFQSLKFPQDVDIDLRAVERKRKDILISSSSTKINGNNDETCSSTIYKSSKDSKPQQYAGHATYITEVDTATDRQKLGYTCCMINNTTTLETPVLYWRETSS